MFQVRPNPRRPCLFLVTVFSVATAMASERLDLSGNLGYSFRSLTGTGTNDTVSNQLHGTVNARSYVGEPGFGTVEVNLNGTQDHETFQLGDPNHNNSTILTGDLNLSMIPQSRAPFQLQFRASDSRVEYITPESSVTNLGSREYSTQHLGLRQSYLTEDGNRFQARYDTNRWNEHGGRDYKDDIIGLEMDLRTPKNSVTAKTSYQTADQSVQDQTTKTVILNVDHFYYPTRALRMDNMLSYFGVDNETTPPLNSTNQGDSSTDLAQISSFIFWRPLKRPLTVSGGVRLYDLSGSTTGNDTTMQTASATAGMFYQQTKNIRYDASLEVAVNDNSIVQTTAMKERIGALYQSDVYPLFSTFTYQWYGSGQAQNQDTGSETLNSVIGRLGHDAQRQWPMSDNATARVSLGQALSGTRQSGDITMTTQRFDNSVSLSWDQHGESGTSYIQISVSDSRGFGDVQNTQQFANFQILRNQTLNRSSSVSGNLTVQDVRQDFNGQGVSDTVTATGEINYQNSGIFGVPRLRFLSDWRLSRAATDQGVDRGEWENRFDYAIGLLNLSLSWRHIALYSHSDVQFSAWRYVSMHGEEDYELIYGQLTRSF